MLRDNADARRRSYFELGLPVVAEGKNYSTLMKEIKGKSILVRVSGIRLYSEHDEYQFHIFSLFFCRGSWAEKNNEDNMHHPCISEPFPYLLLLNIFSLLCFNYL